MSRVLIDTNLLLRIADPGASQHAAAADSISRLIEGGHEVCLCPQNMIEFWAVATRPISANGLGWSVRDTFVEISEMETHFVMLPDAPEIYIAWKSAVSAASATGKRVHDVRLAAVARTHRCDAILTFNTSDFAAIPGLTLIHPDTPEAWPFVTPV